eukprot:CAMPEP_0181502664 /NCGR_PEP_ID=MMETSP1110-20121109/56500_1 /TAXON_ID=174948 /ORGANISM="Symbiodinium sp., Strain CCMP421" /LENGTH=78 /DNA_ID=CAMNT_0023631307 /DNA_START=412 /DNA_END=645 /DNA_ORIENTATION=+
MSDETTPSSILLNAASLASSTLDWKKRGSFFTSMEYDWMSPNFCSITSKLSGKELCSAYSAWILWDVLEDAAWSSPPR